MNYENIQIKVGGVLLPPPISLDYSYEDIDVDSQRNTKDAVMNRNVLRENVLKISLVYAIDDVESVSTVMKAITPKNFEVEFFDILSNSKKIKKMYAGPKTMQILCLNGIWVKSFKFNLTEC